MVMIAAAGLPKLVSPRGSVMTFLDLSAVNSQMLVPENQPHWRWVFLVFKRAFDITVAILLLPLVIVFAALFLLLNPVLNAGPIFFVQTRMGRDCKPFRAFKFRSMRESMDAERAYHEAIETDRVTRFGAFMRKTRIDELPQILNVLRGDMSLIGPRPDAYAHAIVYLREIPEYRARHQVRPGISGFAQVELGYAIGLDATRAKALADLHYIQNASITFELRLVARTIWTVLTRAGA